MVPGKLLGNFLHVGKDELSIKVILSMVWNVVIKASITYGAQI